MLTEETKRKAVEKFFKQFKGPIYKPWSTLLIAVADYITDDSVENLQLVEEHANNLAINNIEFPFYMEEQAKKYLTTFAHHYQYHIDKLKDANYNEWLQILLAAKSLMHLSAYQKIRDASPFKPSFFLEESSGNCFIKVRGDHLKAIICDLSIEKEPIDSSANYILEIPDGDLNKAIVRKEF